MVLDPRYIPMVEYMDKLTYLLGSLGTFPVFYDGMDWKVWAAAVVRLPAVMKFGPPDPYSFSEWIDWAFEFNKTVNQYT